MRGRVRGGVGVARFGVVVEEEEESAAHVIEFGPSVCEDGLFECEIAPAYVVGAD
jgi:hypothetical protein